MPEWARILLGIGIGALVVGAAFVLAFRPNRRDAKEWLASSSGEADEPTKHWPGGPVDP